MPSVTDDGMSIDHLWNDTERRQRKYSDNNLHQCHCVHRIVHSEWPGFDSL